jgi:RES domain-containing protein
MRGRVYADTAETGITFIGNPQEVVRTTDRRYLDQARTDFRLYVHQTLAANQTFGGRYNPPGEFGALYTASDEDTAWAEIAARFRREGILGLPPEMGLLRIVIREGRYVDLTDADVQPAWQVDAAVLEASDPTEDQRDACHVIGRAVRAVADFLLAPSAREEGANIPLFADRDGGGLVMDLSSVSPARPPAHLARVSREAW